MEEVAGHSDESKLKNQVVLVESPTLPGLVVLGIVCKWRQSRGETNFRIPIFFLSDAIGSSIEFPSLFVTLQMFL